MESPSAGSAGVASYRAGSTLRGDFGAGSGSGRRERMRHGVTAGRIVTRAILRMKSRLSRRRSARLRIAAAPARRRVEARRARPGFWDSSAFIGRRRWKSFRKRLRRRFASAVPRFGGEHFGQHRQGLGGVAVLDEEAGLFERERDVVRRARAQFRDELPGFFLVAGYAQGREQREISGAGSPRNACTRFRRDRGGRRGRCSRRRTGTARRGFRKASPRRGRCPVPGAGPFPPRFGRGAGPRAGCLARPARRVAPTRPSPGAVPSSTCSRRSSARRASCALENTGNTVSTNTTIGAIVTSSAQPPRGFGCGSMVAVNRSPKASRVAMAATMAKAVASATDGRA